MRLALVIAVACTAFAAGRASAASLGFDFHDPAEVPKWKPAHDVAQVLATSDGMEIHISGPDPFITGPAIDLPADLPPDATLLLELRLKSDQGGFVEVFHYPAGGHATPARSVTTRVAPRQWQDVRLPLPALERRVAFRIDPPGKGGKMVIASMALRPRLRLPKWPRQVALEIDEAAGRVVRSGDLSIVHDGVTPGGFEVRVAGKRVGLGMTRGLVGYTVGGEPRWSEFPAAATVTADAGKLSESFTWADADGARWHIERHFAPAKRAGAIDIEARVTADRDRDVLLLPALVVLPGAGKSQALFSGLEYLDANEPSSSEADVTGPASVRRVPASSKVTCPLMAVCTDGRYVGLAWERSGEYSALFDSPDRTFNAGGHAIGLVLPGNGPRRGADGAVLPDEPGRLQAGKSIVIRATLLGGSGTTVVPAIQQFVALRGLPPVPGVGMDAHGYDALAAGGWLDSKLREGNIVRHAVWPGFGAGPAADAAVWMRWLAAREREASPDLAARLTETSNAVIGAVPADRYDFAHVGHVTYPLLPSLVFGHVEENAQAVAEHGKRLLGRFEPDGTVRFRADPGKTDFARTHFARDANGLAAPLVTQVLRAAAVSGDADLLREGLRLLRALDRYRATVPRGAQTWEVPLHTPDILASAHLVRAYTLGYELTGDADLLESAKYWAWTGVPFVYLDNPTAQSVGPYATIPVFGASHWIDVWFGRPVQWCGLVYANALYALRGHDPAGPWGRIADGITASGIQQSWPASDRERQGLLPDFYHLAEQTRDGPAINPGTVQACATRLFGGPEPYDFRCFRKHGVMLHAPGPILDAAEDDQGLRFIVEGWPSEPYYVLLSGLKSNPQVQVDRRPLGPGEDCRYDGAGRLILRVRGRVSVRVDTPARP